MRSGFLFLLALLLSATGLRATPPNIVFIMADDLGWHDLGCYGNDFIETPHLDRLATEGIRFTQAYQQTVCSPSRAALMTGMHPARLGITDYLGPEAGEKFLDPKLDTINERLKEADYVSGLVGKWHLTGNYKEGKGSPDKHGWDEVICSETSYIGGGSYFYPYKHIAGLQPRLGDKEYLTDRLNLEACDFIRKHQDKPFFLYLSHYGVHTALSAKEELIQKYEHKPGAGPRKGKGSDHNNPVLAAMMESVDEGVGKIRQTLEELGLTKNTLVIFTSDNGGEAVRKGKGIELLPGITSVAPLRGGKSHLYEGGIRVPLIVSWPGVTPPGSVCASPVNGLDWYPTLLAAAGLKARGPQPMDGVGIMGNLRNPSEKQERTMIWHYPLEKPHFLGGRSADAIRDGDWKLLEFFDTGERELYNLAEDVSEQHNQVAAHPEKADLLGLKLLTWRQSLKLETPKRWHFLQNDQLKIGINLNAGACIGWLSTTKEPEKNVLNTFDPGRYVQQSYYGDPDGSDWNGKPWRYNPVQGGDWHGLPSDVLEFKAYSPTSLYARIKPRHWTTGKLLEDVVMEQWITLEGPLARVRFKMTYSGSAAHKAHHQELPAFFVEPEFGTLAYVEGEPWKNGPPTRRNPGEKNEYLKLTEHWAAWLNADDYGVGIFSPACDEATCYRVPGLTGSCSYLAPIKTMALTPGFIFEYEAFMGIGKLQDLRSWFTARYHDLSSK